MTRRLFPLSPYHKGEMHLKIAFIDQNLSPRTGSRRFTYNVASQLQKLGHEVDILTNRMDQETCFREYLSLSVEVVSRGKQRTRKPLLGHRRDNPFIRLWDLFEYYLTQTTLIKNLSRRIENTECDVAMVHYHGEHWLLPFFYYLSKPSGAVYLNVVPPAPPPWALPFQGLTLRRRLEDRLLDLPPVGRWKKVSFRKLALLITPSRYLLEQARRQGIIRQKKAEVVQLGVDHSEFYPTGEEEPFALYLGRIHPHKSLELAILAMKNTNRNKSLIIAGDLDERYSWYQEKLTSLAEKAKISDRFQMILSPPDSDVVRLMQRCSVFLFPSTIDTFGLVVLEAMACGKPVVACNSGGVPEIVNDAGFLLKPDVKQWQETVSKLLSNSQLRHRMGKRSLIRSKLFSWENTTKRLLNAFNNLDNT